MNKISFSVLLMSLLICIQSNANSYSSRGKSGLGIVDTKYDRVYAGKDLNSDWCISKVSSNVLECQTRDHHTNFLFDQYYESFCFLRVQTRAIVSEQYNGVVLSRDYNEHIAYKIFEYHPKQLSIISEILDIPLAPIMTVEQLGLFNNSISQVIQNYQGKPDAQEAIDSIKNVINQKSCSNLKLAKTTTISNEIGRKKIGVSSTCSDPIFVRDRFFGGHRLSTYKSCFQIQEEVTNSVTTLDLDSSGYALDKDYEVKNNVLIVTKSICNEDESRTWDESRYSYDVKKEVKESCEASRKNEENGILKSKK